MHQQADTYLCASSKHLKYVSVFMFMFMFLSFSVKVSLYYKQYFYRAMSNWLHYFCGEWEGWALLNRFNHTSWVTAVTPTDRPKSVRNSCVINFLWRFYVVTLLFGLFCGCRGFCHRTESDLFLFLPNQHFSVFRIEQHTKLIPILLAFCVVWCNTGYFFYRNIFIHREI